MLQSGVYVLVDKTIIVAEGAVTFPQFLNPRMDFDQARQMMDDGAELRRASKIRANSECAITSNQNPTRSLPKDPEFWLNVEDGYQPFHLSDEDRQATDWVVIVPPLSVAFHHQGHKNYISRTSLPANRAHMPQVAVPV